MPLFTSGGLGLKNLVLFTSLVAVVGVYAGVHAGVYVGVYVGVC